MFQKIQAYLIYFIKFLKNGSFQEAFEIYKYVEKRNFFHFLRHRLDRNCIEVNIKDIGTRELNQFLDFLKCRKEHKGKGIYRWIFDGKEIHGNLKHIEAIQMEYFSNLMQTWYSYDYKDKTVLDVGGFIGDSALYFLESGAKRVIIYEPAEINLKAMSYNLKPYKKRVEIHKKAVSQQDGSCTLSSSTPPGCHGFGCLPGKFSMTCEGVSFQSLLSRSYDVAKLDCEGAEQYLCEVDPGLIRKTPYWIVETHNETIYSQILKKFNESGFVKKQDWKLVEKPLITLLHFEIKTD